MTRRPAAFLDRDGTLIEDAHYLADPSRVRVLPGVYDAVRVLHDANVPPVVVTNQSGIAQGLVTPAQYEAIRIRVEALFRDHGTPLAASYHCPHHPSVSGYCECRKPNTGMYRDAAEALQLQTDLSLYAGDRRRDVEPSLTLGGFGVLIPSNDTPEPDVIWAEAHAQVADSLSEAVHRYLAWLSDATA